MVSLQVSGLTHDHVSLLGIFWDPLAVQWLGVCTSRARVQPCGWGTKIMQASVMCGQMLSKNNNKMKNGSL